MARYVDKDCKEFKDAEKVADMVNSLVYNHEAFCQSMSRQHRTLQENFTELCIHWLATTGNENYQYDDRNKCAHIIGKQFLENILNK